MKKLMGITRNGIDVYYNQKFLDHMKAHPDVKFEDIQRAINMFDYRPTFFIGSIKLPYICGETHCLKILPGDETVLITRPNREGPTRFFVNDKKPEPTDRIVIGLCTDREGDTYIFTSWYGFKARKEPWDKSIRSNKERKECEEFWSTHALIQQAF